SATTWQAGDLITYSQVAWGDSPANSTAAALLVANFNSLYVGGFEVGLSGSAGFSMVFLDAPSALVYLPSSGPGAGALNADRVNPSSSPSEGLFGGLVVALKLNIDSSDAGLTLGSLGIPFGDLILTDFDTTLPDLNGLTVREFLGVA